MSDAAMRAAETLRSEAEAFEGQVRGSDPLLCPRHHYRRAATSILPSTST